jgi:hypothetical protein
LCHLCHELEFPAGANMIIAPVKFGMSNVFVSFTYSCSMYMCVCMYACLNVCVLAIYYLLFYFLAFCADADGTVVDVQPAESSHGKGGLRPAHRPGRGWGGNNTSTTTATASSSNGTKSRQKASMTSHVKTSTNTDNSSSTTNATGSSSINSSSNNNTDNNSNNDRIRVDGALFVGALVMWDGNGPLARSVCVVHSQVSESGTYVRICLSRMHDFLFVFSMGNHSLRRRCLLVSCLALTLSRSPLLALSQYLPFKRLK